MFLIKFWVLDFCCSVTKLYPTHCDPLDHHIKLPCPSLSPRVCSNSCPLSWWCHPTIKSSVDPFSWFAFKYDLFFTFGFYPFCYNIIWVWQSLNLLYFHSPIFFNLQINFFLKFRKYSAIITSVFLFTNISPVFFRFQLEC